MQLNVKMSTAPALALHWQKSQNPNKGSQLFVSKDVDTENIPIGVLTEKKMEQCNALHNTRKKERCGAALVQSSVILVGM